MTADPPRPAPSLDRRGLRPTLLVLALALAPLLVFDWVRGGVDRPYHGVLVTYWTFVLTSLLAGPAARRLPARWQHVPRAEAALHRLLGVRAFGWLLDVSGWNRYLTRPMRGFTGARGGLRALELSVREGAAGHAACFVIHLALAGLALATGHGWGAVWIMTGGIIVHLYPVLLQRSLLLRLQPLLEG